jgi:transcriptional regulator with XRE-family HTH domain
VKAQVLAAGFNAHARSDGWSQEEFAYRANIDRTYMGGVERGERNLSLKKLFAIAQALGRDVGSSYTWLARARYCLNKLLSALDSHEVQHGGGFPA